MRQDQSGELQLWQDSPLCPLLAVWHENITYILWLSFLICIMIVFLIGSHDKGNGEKQDVI